MSLRSNSQKEQPSTSFVQDRTSTDERVRVQISYDQIYQQALHEIQQPGSISTGRMVTAWGTNK